MNEHRVAVVTGAARGLGRAVAQRLVHDGWGVVLVDIGEALDDTAATLDGGTDRVLAVQADVSDPAACLALAETIRRTWGRADALINNAGIGGPSTAVHETDPDIFRRVLEVNLVGPFLMARAVIPLILAGGRGGAVVNVCSMFGQQAAAGVGAYSASKGGLVLLGQAMALELASQGVTVNSVAPGNMLTAMHVEHVQWLADRAGTSYEDALAEVRATVPLGRHGTGEDIAGTVAWLLSPDASYVTGQTVTVNGGIHLS